MRDAIGFMVGNAVNLIGVKYSIRRKKNVRRLKILAIQHTFGSLTGGIKNQ
jgi:hypothetical protein